MDRISRCIFLVVIVALSAACRPGVSEVQHYRPGDIVPDAYVSEVGDSGFFSCQMVPDDIFALMQGRSFKEDCTVPRESLRYLLCLHRDFYGHATVGEMVVNVVVAEDVLDILHELYKESYPIERMRLVDYWDADDEMSMRANNSSCFNFRFVGNSKVVSKHGYGIAVDINPLYNPYYKALSNGKVHIEPSISATFLDRKADFPYKIEKGDLCYRLFKEKGFDWGGDWRFIKDYQHFELGGNEDGSSLEFDHNVWNCGQLQQDGARAFHTFTAVNVSNASVRIQNFVPSCNCVQVLAQAVTLEPGEMLDITVSYNPYGEKGTVYRYVELLDAGGKSLGKLEINAEIIPTI